MKREMQYKKEYDRWEIAGSIVYRKNVRPISLFYFFDIDQIVSTWQSIDKYEETGINESIFNIGMLTSDPNGGLYIGFGDTNRDNVYRVNWELGHDKFSVLASSIWEFIEGLEQDYNNS